MINNLKCVEDIEKSDIPCLFTFKDKNLFVECGMDRLTENEIVFLDFLETIGVNHVDIIERSYNADKQNYCYFINTHIHPKAALAYLRLMMEVWERKIEKVIKNEPDKDLFIVDGTNRVQLRDHKNEEFLEEYCILINEEEINDFLKLKGILD